MAGAIAAAITTVIPSLAAYQTAVTAVVGVGLYAGTAYAQYLISQAQQPKPKIGTKLRFSFGGDVPQSIIVGECETSGSLVYAGSWGRSGGTPNAYMVQVFCLSDMPSTDIKARIWINGEKDEIDFDAGQKIIDGNSIGYPVKGKRKDSDDKMWIKFKDGGQTVADPYLRDKFGGKPKPWKATMIGRGRTLVIVTTKYDKKEPDSVPLCRFVIRGIKLYNPKKDDTNGGTGDHRWSNQSTHEFDDNPAVINYNIARGIYYGDEWMYGGRNWPKYALDNNSFVASINASNDNIPVKAGGTIRRWSVGGEISLDSSCFDTLDEINAACNGRMATSGGKLYFDCGSYGASEFVFQDGDLFVNEQVESKVSTSPRDVFNTIIATYTEPDIGGEMKACRPRTNQEFIDADGGIIRRSTPSLRFCRDNRRAQRIAERMLRDNRRTVTRQVIMGPERRDGMRANLVGAWDSDRYQYSEKEWIFGDTMKYPNGVMLVELRELNPNDDSWDAETEEDDYIVGEWEREVPNAQVMPITVEQWPIKNSAGLFKAPGLRVVWDPEDPDGDNKRVVWQLRLLDSSEVMASGSADFDQGFDIVAKGLVKNEAYQLRAKLIPIADWRLTAFTDWDDTTVYPGGLDYILAPDADSGGTVDDDPPPAISPGPSLSVRTRVHRSSDVVQRIIVSLDISARNPTETYRIRVLDTTESPDEVRNFFTGEFPKDFGVQSGHDYEIRVAPVSRFGVIGPYTTALSITVAKKGGAVPDVAGESLQPGHKRNTIEWDPVDTDAYPDYDVTQIQRANNAGFSVNVKNFKSKTTQFVNDGLGNAEEKFYRLRHIDTSGNPGNWSSTLSGTTARLQSPDYEDLSVETDKIAFNAINDAIKATAKPGAFDENSNDKTSANLFARYGGTDHAVVIPNPGGAPIGITANISLGIKRVGTTGSSPPFDLEAKGKATLSLILKNKVSGEKFVIGRITMAFASNKRPPQGYGHPRQLSKAYTFSKVKKGEVAKFQLIVERSWKRDNGYFTDCIFVHSGQITFSYWKR